MTHWDRARDLILPLLIIGSLFVILIPLPPALMDLLLVANITVAVLMLLTTILIQTPMEFSIFPSLLLATTLGRLVLNVATTRLILTRADSQGLAAAGSLVEGFGGFVAGDRLAVGLVIFAIIVVIQFLVITKGATRISEVAARFALDGMPGRQMAIDADLNAGIIDGEMAGQRRLEIQEQADFYGAMDGASKFVRGDAVAGVVIIMINIVGGLFIGVVQAGMDLSTAANVFTRLTIGDGLVTQIPAFLISMSAGLLVTRSHRQSHLPREFVRQLFMRPESLLIAAGFLGLLVMAKLPMIPLFVLGLGCASVAIVILQQRPREDETSRGSASTSPRARPAVEEKRVEDFLGVDPLEMEIGVGLIALADPRRGGDLMSRITSLRNQVAGELGMVLPKVRIRDNLQLPDNGYRIKVAGNPVAEGIVPPHRQMAAIPGGELGEMQGTAGQDPVTGRTVLWIDPENRSEAESLGYQVTTTAQLMILHLRKVAYQHADELLTRDATRQLLEELRRTSPAVVDELVPDPMKLGEVQQVLQRLLRERVPIRQLGLILETLGDAASRTRDPAELTEEVRRRLARTITNNYRVDAGHVPAITLDAELEQRWSQSALDAGVPYAWRLSPSDVQALCQSVSPAVDRFHHTQQPPVLVVRPEIRTGIKHALTSRFPEVAVLSYGEIPTDSRVESQARVNLPASEPRPFVSCPSDSP